MHTCGTIARPWRQDLTLGASQSGTSLTVVMKANAPWSGTLVIDKPRHRLEMGFTKDWPRMNTMPEWFTVEPNETYLVEDIVSGTASTSIGAQLHAGLPLTLPPGTERQLRIRRRE